MLRYKLRTLLILLTVLPPLLWIGWGKYQVWKAEQERQRSRKSMPGTLKQLKGVPLVLQKASKL